jgi:protocatechuate 3,4-dioxygenase beta subunit
MTRKFDRRQALAAFGTVSLGTVLAACGGDDKTAQVKTSTGETATVEPKTGSGASDLFEGSASCSLTPEETEGPFYFDVDSIRSDIREDREGAPLRLAIRVRDAGSCEPIENAVVDIWHCDALGGYSGFDGEEGETYLRGAQVTNADGIVQFKTIYPGWYRGRTVHIHAKVHLDKRTVLTSQLYFDDDFTSEVFEAEPYSGRGGRDTFNDGDGIFDDRLLMTLSEEKDGSLGVINFDVQS